VAGVAAAAAAAVCCSDDDDDDDDVADGRSLYQFPASLQWRN